ncbi:hypothetical protein O4J56_13835 [Nocardiopsis sp. RSe5-2]|uniref:Uncharacterized protein n=1 Tax=Nocardiopsis endophytica TaxID=3018445 RepID=A0ABT4U436_9ACTN|nr:hypothetical protein [Nocardiopsis endophytica]MDA2811717.1 hypothetical protein [Nocardiopsis endophytica]
MERLGPRIRGRIRAAGARGAAWAHRRAEAEERHRCEVMRGRLDVALRRLGTLLERGRPWTPGDLHAHADLLEEHRVWTWRARCATRSDELVDVYQKVLAAQRRAARWV